MSDDLITIKRSRFAALLEVEEMMNKLRAAGVDNWEGYSEALGNDEESEEDIYGE